MGKAFSILVLVLIHIVVYGAIVAVIGGPFLVFDLPRLIGKKWSETRMLSGWIVDRIADLVDRMLPAPR